jgi:heme/copper-type cytochrome/quinol oxidase subunit 2
MPVNVNIQDVINLPPSYGGESVWYVLTLCFIAWTIAGTIIYFALKYDKKNEKQEMSKV